MTLKVDLSLPSEEILLGIINYENPRANLTFKKVKFSPKGCFPADYMGRDTKIDVIPLPGSGLYGSITFYYTKINLTTYLGSRYLVIEPNQYRYTNELMAEVLTQFGIRITAADIIADTIGEAGPGTIRFAPKSLLYKGTINYYVGSPFGALTDRVIQRQLDGFYKPVI